MSARPGYTAPVLLAGPRRCLLNSRLPIYYPEPALAPSALR